ncbi:MAG: tetratricopeptide repeat protein [Oscillospiraceae bacterium]|nr:tetratricopeptide repeat protein [Oscillospiraceae bacterium]
MGNFLGLSCFLSNFIRNSKVTTPISLFVSVLSAAAGLMGLCTREFSLVLIIVIVLLPLVTNLILACIDASVSNFYPFDTLIIGNTFNSFSRTSWMFRKGVHALHLCDYNKALDFFNELENHNMADSWRAVLSYFHARCYQIMGYPTNAAKYFEKAIELNINCDDIYIMAGRCYTNTGCFHEAMEVYNSLLKRNTDIDYILTDMGLTCLKSGDAEKALEYFEKSIESGKNYAFALGGCSLVHLQRKNLDLSMEYFSRALTNNMDDIDGFKSYYCKIAEGAGLLDKIGENMKNIKPENVFE